MKCEHDPPPPPRVSHSPSEEAPSLPEPEVLLGSHVGSTPPPSGDHSGQTPSPPEEEDAGQSCGYTITPPPELEALPPDRPSSSFSSSSSPDSSGEEVGRIRQPEKEGRTQTLNESSTLADSNVVKPSTGSGCGLDTRPGDDERCTLAAPPPLAVPGTERKEEEGERRERVLLSGRSQAKRKGRHRKADARAVRGARGQRSTAGGTGRGHPRYGMGGGEFLGTAVTM